MADATQPRMQAGPEPSMDQQEQSPLARRFDVALLDLDGVVYLGEQAVPGAAKALAECRSLGMRLAFVTNNASRTPGQVVALLNRLDVPAHPAEVTTSALAAAHELSDRFGPGAKVLVLGAAGLVEAVTERGLLAVSSAQDEPVAVVQGYSPDLGWRELAEAAMAINGGAFFLATNLDLTVPSARGPLPGNGSMVAALRAATGVDPVATGKPDPRMHAESVERSGADRPLVVGDRLDTDIEGASAVGCPALLVLTGVTDAHRLLQAIPRHRPTFVGRDVSALLLAHEAVQRIPAGAGPIEFRCGGAVATGSPDGLSVQGGGGPDGLDGLRALMTAAWALADSGADPMELSRQITAADDIAAVWMKDLGLTDGR